MPAANAYVYFVSQHIFLLLLLCKHNPRSGKRIEHAVIHHRGYRGTRDNNYYINSSNGCLVSMSPAAPSQPQLTHSYARQGSEWRGRGYTHRVTGRGRAPCTFGMSFFLGCIYPTAVARDNYFFLAAKTWADRSKKKESQCGAPRRFFPLVGNTRAKPSPSTKPGGWVELLARFRPATK